MSRSLIDATTQATFALSATTGTAAKSSGIDTGADREKEAAVEFELLVPALAAALVVEGAIVQYAIETSTTSTFASVAETIAYATQTAATGGVAAKTIRGRMAGDASRYVRASVNINTNATTGGSTAAGSTATFQARY